MTRHLFRRLGPAATLSLVITLIHIAATIGADPPSVVFFVVDNVGAASLGTGGARGISTPNIDRLAAGGVLFENFLNNSGSLATQVSLLTGHPAQDQALRGLEPAVTGAGPTIAHVMAANGYQTMLVGKWPFSVAPDRAGFQRAYCLWGDHCDAFHPGPRTEGQRAPFLLYPNVPFPWIEDGKVNYRYQLPEGVTTVTDAFATAAVKFVRQAKRQQPLFLYIAFAGPAAPLQVTRPELERLEERFTSGWRGASDDEVPNWESVEDKVAAARRMAAYASMVQRVDAAVGRILNELEASGHDNTIIVFVSTSGVAGQLRIRTVSSSGIVSFSGLDAGWARQLNGGRGGAHTVFEGAINTPLVIRLPERNGQARVRVPVDAVDVAATIANATLVKWENPSRGKNLKAAMDGSGLDRKSMIVESDGHSAVRLGNRWKAVRSAPEFDWDTARLKPSDWSLYDLTSDPLELQNLAADDSGILKTARQAWGDWTRAHRRRTLNHDRLLDREISALSSRASELNKKLAATPYAKLGTDINGLAKKLEAKRIRLQLGGLDNRRYQFDYRVSLNALRRLVEAALKEATREQLEAVAKDLQCKVNSAEGPGDVVVESFQRQTEVHNFFPSANPFYEDPAIGHRNPTFPFNNPTNPSMRQLPPGKYMIWISTEPGGAPMLKRPVNVGLKPNQHDRFRFNVP